MGVARGHSESSLVRGNSLVRGFVFRGSTVGCYQLGRELFKVSLLFKWSITISNTVNLFYIQK